MHCILYQHFRVQDHSEIAPHKYVQSNICLNQVYAPGMERSGNQLSLHSLKKCTMSLRELLNFTEEKAKPHQSKEWNHPGPFRIHILCLPISSHVPKPHTAT